METQATHAAMHAAMHNALAMPLSQSQVDLLTAASSAAAAVDDFKGRG